MARTTALSKVITEINNKFGANTVIDLNSNKRNVEILCSTGSLGLDIAIGGGYPKGRIIEVFGPESSGKTTLTIHAIADVQKRNGVAAFIDAENAFDAFYARNLGVDLEELIFSQPDNGEMALDTTVMLAASGEVDLIIVDSVAALMPQAEIEGDAGDSKVGLRARLLNQSIVKLSSICNKKGCTVIFLNQLRDTIGNFYGPSEVTTGGKALKFFASIRLNIRRIGSNEGEIEGGDKGYVSNSVRVKSVKNKVYPPFREAEFDIIFGKGISQESEYVGAALKLDILFKDNSGIKFREETPLYPKDTAITSSHPKLITLFSEVTDENHPLYWVKREIELRVDLHMERITADELDSQLEEAFSIAEKNNELGERYFELASKASSSSKLVEAKYYIDLAIIKTPFEKSVIQKYKDITKRFEQKLNTFTEESHAEVLDLETDKKYMFYPITGELTEIKENEVEEIIEE